MSLTRSQKASLHSDFRKDISSLIKNEIIKGMSSEEMKNAILNQVKQCIQSEINSIVKPLEEDLASIKYIVQLSVCSMRLLFTELLIFMVYACSFQLLVSFSYTHFILVLLFY